MVDCPECGTSFSGPKCSCGYRVRASGPVSVKVPCAYANCPNPAKTRSKIRANLCLAHDHAEFMQGVRAELKAKGLTTTGEKRAECQRLLYAMKTGLSAPGSRDWAKDIMKRFEDGDVITDYQIDTARKALRTEA